MLWGAWAYLAALVAFLLLLRLAADAWWPATVLAFGPRWVVLAPLPFLAVAAVCFRRGALGPLLIGGLIGIGPIMGLCVSGRSLAGPPPRDGDALRIVSCNFGAGSREDELVQLLKSARPDVVVLVEWPNERPFPKSAGEGWHLGRHAGLFVASRFPIVESRPLQSSRLEPWNTPALQLRLQTPGAEIGLVAVHLETPREGLEALMSNPRTGRSEMERTTRIRRTESELASRLAHEFDGPTLVAGDFNMPVDSAIYRSYWAGWQNAFSAAGTGFGFTKFTRTIGIRIDHVLADASWSVVSAHVGESLGGDHRPVIVDLRRR